MIHEVEAIIGRKVFSGKVLYLTKWKGFPLSDATWESVKVLKPYRKLIKLYNEKLRNDSNDSETPAEPPEEPVQPPEEQPTEKKESNPCEQSIVNYLADLEK